MNEDHFTNLVHGEIDGTNSKEESAELRTYLRENPTAEEFQADMHRLNDVLGSVEDEDPPADLSATILAQIEARQATKVVAFRPSGERKWLGSRAILPYVATLAAGLVLGLIATPLLDQGATGRPWDPEDLSGAMVPGTVSARASEPLGIEADGVDGTVRLARSDSKTLVFLEFHASGEIHIVLEYDLAKIGFAGLNHEEGPFGALEAQANLVTVTGAGDFSFTVLLDRLERSATELSLTVYRDGVPVHERALPLEWLDTPG